MINPLDYLPPPRTNVAGGISLAHGLYAATPKNPNEALSRLAADLKARADLLETAWTAREKAERSREASEAKPADLRLDAAVRGLYNRILAATDLSPELPEQSVAEKLLKALFGDGLGWLTLRYDEEWAHVAKLLKRIDDEGHAADLDTIAGPVYLAELRRAYERYGEVLGKTQPKPAYEAEPANMLDGLKELSRVIGSYTLQVLAMADETKPETLEVVRNALRPIDEYRAAMNRTPRRSSGTKEPEPEPEPVTPE